VDVLIQVEPDEKRKFRIHARQKIQAARSLKEREPLI